MENEKQVPLPFATTEAKKYDCDHCHDTGLYDACCRPHACNCKAAERAGYLRPMNTNYGNYGCYN